MTSNIDKTDKTNRIVFGVLLIVFALLGGGAKVMLVLGAILLIEGIMGYCAIPMIVEKVKGLMAKKTQ